MDMILTFTIVFATLMFIVAVINWLNYRRKLSESFELKAILKEAESEKKFLKEEITRITKLGGIGESSVLSLIGDISRIENTLYYMQKTDCEQTKKKTESEHTQEVRGCKQIAQALKKMKGTLKVEDYSIEPLLGTDYREDMHALVVFVEDESIPPGRSVIISVQKPQVNRGGRMIQAASITVGQNLQ